MPVYNTRPNRKITTKNCFKSLDRESFCQRANRCYHAIEFLMYKKYGDFYEYNIDKLTP